MRKIGFRAALKKLGATDIHLHTLKGCDAETCGYITGTGLNPAPFIFSQPIFKMGQTYYVIYKDHPIIGSTKVMYRETKDRTNSTGGVNIWNFEQVMNDLGYTVK